MRAHFIVIIGLENKIGGNLFALAFRESERATHSTAIWRLHGSTSSAVANAYTHTRPYVVYDTWVNRMCTFAIHAYRVRLPSTPTTLQLYTFRSFVALWPGTDLSSCALSPHTESSHVYHFTHSACVCGVCVFAIYFAYWIFDRKIMYTDSVIWLNM